MFCRRIIWTNSGEGEVKRVLTGPPGTRWSPKKWHGISENKLKTSTYLGHGFTQSNSHSSFLLQFSLLEKKVLKRESYKNNNKKMEQQSYAADLRPTERFPAPLWSLVSLYEPVCASHWRELPILPKENLLRSYYFSLSWFLFLLSI